VYRTISTPVHIRFALDPSQAQDDPTMKRGGSN
jgi:hypothetical protein